MEGVMRQMGLVSQSAESRCQALAYRGDKKRRGAECEWIINETGGEGERKNFFCLFLPVQLAVYYCSILRIYHRWPDSNPKGA